jgi:two-component system, sensor histidine kinase RegB
MAFVLNREKIEPRNPIMEKSMSLVQLLSQGAPEANLRCLYVLRNVAIAGQSIAVLWVHYGLDMHLPLAAMGSVIGALGIFNVITCWRLKNPFPVTDLEIFLQLLVDTVALTALLYLSGGASNPFISLYLMPLVIAAITLPHWYLGLMTALTVVCYTLLMFEALALPMHQDGASDFDLHRLGMWSNFVLSAALIMLFIARMAATLRERDHMLAAAREENLRNEQIVALGTFAAGAAHELSTPLSTMAVLAREMERDYARVTALAADVRCLREQIDICKRSLTRLLAASGHKRADDNKSVCAETFLNDLLEHWRLMRPTVPVASQWMGLRPAPLIEGGQILAQAIINLFNNAADASPTGVEVSGRWSDTELSIEIRDRGPGITPERAERATEAFVTTKSHGEGLGLGLFLANATVERLGGKVRLVNRRGGGACTQVTLPLAAQTPA